MTEREIDELAERIVTKLIPDMPFMHTAHSLYVDWVRGELIKAIQGGETNESRRDRVDRGADAGTA